MDSASFPTTLKAVFTVVNGYPNILFYFKVTYKLIALNHYANFPKDAGKIMDSNH